MIEMKKVAVIPVDLPFMISPSGSNSRLVVDQGNGGQYAKLKIVGFFGSGTKVSKRWGEYVPLTMKFGGMFSSKSYPAYCDFESKNLDSYCWEKIPEFRSEDGSLVGSKERYWQYWDREGKCPNPSVYILENSAYLSDLELPKIFKHFLVDAGDYYFEFVAEEVSWSVDQ